MFKIIKFLLRLYFLLLKTSFKMLTYKEANVIIWIPRINIKYLMSNTLVNDLGWINSLSESKISFNVKFSKSIGKYHNKTIILNYSRFFLKKLSFKDYSKNFIFIISQLENQGNFIIPSSKEAKLWENKIYMTDQFSKLGISTPKTNLLNNLKEIECCDLTYPYLIKEEHSASAKGVHKISDKIALRNLLNDDYFKRNFKIIVQQLLNMRRDLRVIFVGDKIVNFYWRINNEKKWKPTSTSHGSSVDFENFPEKWRSFLIKEFLKLNIYTGAFDVAWENDNINSTPKILEVSPYYQLNPKTSNKNDLLNYGNYKKKIFFSKRSFDYNYINQTFSVINSIVTLYIKRKKLNSSKNK
jgi:glutathione synthase/RimK-type ligase-like ATP-grasp enzyme